MLLMEAFIVVAGIRIIFIVEAIMNKFWEGKPLDSVFYHCGSRLVCQNKCFHFAARPRTTTTASTTSSHIMAASNVYYVVEN